MHNWSQYDEQSFILHFFCDRRSGRFLDIGSHAAKENSNTRALAELGWSGTCVEPSPWVFPALCETYSHRPDINLVNAAIDAESKLVRWYDSGGDQISTTEVAHAKTWQDRGHPYRRAMHVATVTFGQLLNVLPGPYPFVSIDTEGSNLRALKAAPLVEMGCELLCVEKEPGEGMLNHLKMIGYASVRETPGNYLASR